MGKGNLMEKINSALPQNPSLQKTEKKKDEPATSPKTGSLEKRTESLEIPDYVVEISAEKIDKKSTYSPAEVKSKARSLLHMGIMPEDQRQVLQKILDTEEQS